MKIRYLINQKTSLIVSLIMLLAATTACEQEYENYSGESYIQFGPPQEYIYRPTYQYRDTTKNFTFVYNSISEVRDTLYFDVYAMGGPADYDRPFIIEQEIDGNMNCEPGVHYVGLDEEEVKSCYVFKAGEVHTLVPLVLLRDETLQTGEYELKIVLKPNEHFQLGQSSLSWRKAYVTDELICPDEWSSIKQLGKYSKVKHRFLIEVTGKKWDSEFLNELKSDVGAANYWKTYATNEINEYNRNHPGAPLTDEDGELVTMG